MPRLLSLAAADLEDAAFGRSVPAQSAVQLSSGQATGQAAWIARVLELQPAHLTLLTALQRAHTWAAASLWLHCYL